MLRSIFVIVLLTVGAGFAFMSPLYAACLYLWLAYFRPEAWAWSGVFATLNLSYIAGIFLLVRTVVAGTPIRINWRSALLIAFLVLSLVSTLLGTHPEYSFRYWQEFAKTIIVSYVLTLLINSPSDFRLILFVISCSLGFEAVKQGWAQMILNPGAQNDNSVPFLGDNNLVAVGMAMLLPIVSSLASASSGWQKRAFQFASVGVLYRGLSTYSRGGFLAIAAVGSAYLWRSPRKGRTLIAIVIAAAIVVPVLPQQFWDRMSTIIAPAEQRDDSQEGRLYFWQVAVRMANDHPLLGIGHSAFQPTYNQYDTTRGLYGTNRAVHSAWFGVLAELGYVGLLLFVAIVFSSWLACRKVRLSAKRGEIPITLGHYAIGLESALIAFCVGGSFVSFQYCEMLWHFFALTIVLERVAATEAAARLVAVEPKPAAAVQEPEPDFVWA